MTNGKSNVRREEATLCHRRFFTRVSGEADVRRCVWVRGGACLKWPPLGLSEQAVLLFPNPFVT